MAGAGPRASAGSASKSGLDGNTFISAGLPGFIPAPTLMKPAGLGDAVLAAGAGPEALNTPAITPIEYFARAVETLLRACPLNVSSSARD
ncbi:MAG: hypothetical protein Q8M18_16720 [Bradyrhizobium sp.]|nr:hypothetical protein [Bradyrhizobium sp.]